MLLEEEELRALGDAWLAHAASEVLLESARLSAAGGGGARGRTASAAAAEARVAALTAQLSALLAAGPAARAARLGFAGPAEMHWRGGAAGAAAVDPHQHNHHQQQQQEQWTTEALVCRRERSIGPGSESLTYGSAPVRAARGEGTWVIDDAGRRYLCAATSFAEAPLTA